MPFVILAAEVFELLHDYDQPKLGDSLYRRFEGEEYVYVVVELSLQIRKSLTVPAS